MVPRVAIELAAVNPALVAALWPTLTALALVPLAAVAFALKRRPATASSELRLGNPLQLSAALAFGALLVVLFVASEGLRSAFGDRGAYAVAAIAALLDVDAVTLTFAEAAALGKLDPTTATRAIALAILVNTGVKAVLATLLGGVAMLRTATAVLAAALAAGAVTAIATL
jgi:uncharacterized membrane protein (DUF4010 family)